MAKASQWVFGLLLLLGLPSFGSADAPATPTAEEDARTLFELATRHYEAGRLEEAIREFSTAYELFPVADMQYNLYLAHRDSGHVEEAAAALERYLDGVDNIDDERRASLRRRLETLRGELASQRVEEVEEEDVVPSSAAEDSSSPLQTAGIITLSVGGAALIVSLIEGLVARGRRSDHDDLCSGGSGGNECPVGQQQSIVSSFETHRNAAWGLLYAGGAIAITGTILLLLGRKGDSAVDANAFCDGDGCQALLRGQF